jgi:hypothetical protein
MNEIPYIPWKGKTFNQITTSIQKNAPNSESKMVGNLLFLAHPVKHYRKELATATVKTCNPRTSTKIDDINAPNGYLVNPVSSTTVRTGLPNTLDINLTENRTERPGTCGAFTQGGVCLDQAQNARNRVRSAGMIKKVYNPNKMVDNYYTSTQQYLASRSLGFKQNQYNFLKSGNAAAKPGANDSTGNVYGANNSINYCPNSSTKFAQVYYKPNNSQYAQEGGVSAGERLLRLKYDTITQNGVRFARQYGQEVSSALAHGQENNFTIKDKMGFPLPDARTPVFSKYYPDQITCRIVDVPAKRG